MVELFHSRTSIGNWNFQHNLSLLYRPPKNTLDKPPYTATLNTHRAGAPFDPNVDANLIQAPRSPLNLDVGDSYPFNTNHNASSEKPITSSPNKDINNIPSPIQNKSVYYDFDVVYMDLPQSEENNTLQQKRSLKWNNLQTGIEKNLVNQDVFSAKSLTPQDISLNRPMTPTGTSISPNPRSLPNLIEQDIKFEKVSANRGCCGKDDGCSIF